MRGWEKQKDLADEYGISPGSIMPVLSGEYWPHAGGPLHTKRRELTDDFDWADFFGPGENGDDIDREIEDLVL